jgi:hypothetical protein
MLQKEIQMKLLRGKYTTQKIRSFIRRIIKCKGSKREGMIVADFFSWQQLFTTK